MKLKHNKYSFFIALLAVVGLFSSLVHYHSEGLECLEHAEEAHIVQTQDFCPISTLVSDDDFSASFSFEIILPQVDQLIDFDSEDEFETFLASKSGRSPPYLV